MYTIYNPYRVDLYRSKYIISTDSDTDMLDNHTNKINMVDVFFISASTNQTTIFDGDIKKHIRTE